MGNEYVTRFKPEGPPTPAHGFTYQVTHKGAQVALCTAIFDIGWSTLSLTHLSVSSEHQSQGLESMLLSLTLGRAKVLQKTSMRGSSELISPVQLIALGLSPTETLGGGWVLDVESGGHHDC